MYWRRPDAFTNPQFWAEDGAIFFQQQYSDGYSAVFRPYNGYQHLLPRLIAALADLLHIPLTHIPAFYIYAALLITMAVALAPWYLLRLPAAQTFLLSLSITALPVGGEVYMNLANLQWLLVPFIFLVLLSGKERTVFQLIFLLPALLLAGLTGPFALIFLPAAVLKLLLEKRTKTGWYVFFTLLLPAVMQLYFLLQPGTHRGVVPAAVPQCHFLLFPANYLAQLSGLHSGNFTAASAGIWLLAVALLMVFTYHFITRLRQRSHTVYLLSGLLLILFTIYYAFWKQEWQLMPFGTGQRYFFLPVLFTAWYILLSIRRQWRLAGIGLLGAVLFMMHAEDMRFRLADMEWKKQIRAYEQGGSKIIPVNPPGFFIILR